MNFTSKHKKVGFLVIGLSLSFAAGAYADSAIKKVEAYLRPDYTIKVSGKALTLSNPPLIYNNSTYLPVAELGKVLNADIVWESGTKTVFINPKIYQGQPETNPDTLETMKIGFMQPQQLTYLGRTYEVLFNDSYPVGRYIREKDLQRMGIDTGGMKKVKEEYSKTVFVPESEYKNAWVEKPMTTYLPYPSVAVTETNSEKKEFLRSLKLDYAYLPANGTDEAKLLISEQLRLGTLYVIDPIAGKTNEYEALFYLNAKYYRLYLKIAQVDRSMIVNGVTQTVKEWTIRESSMQLLGPLTDNANTNPYYQGGF